MEVILKTLYITDLDGTLLNDYAKLTKESYKILQPMLDNGLNFTIATARSHNSALQIIRPLKVKLPILCHNGTFIYDPVKKDFVHKFILPTEDITCIIDVAVSYNLSPFIYTLTNKTAHVYHAKPKSTAEKIYYNQRQQMGDKRFINDDNYQKYINEDAFYISILGPYNKTAHIYSLYEKVEGVVVSLTQDVYNENSWWLEIMPEKAGKGNAVKFLKELYKPEKIVCFGDNYNDITMFEKSDYGVCVSNGVDKLKEIADEIIGSCNDSSVAKFIDKHFNL